MELIGELGAIPHMAHLVSVLEHIAATTGAAVLYLHHVNKGSARDGQTDQQQAAGLQGLPHLGGEVEVDFLRKFSGVGGIDETTRHFGKIGVAEPVRAIGKREFHRLGDHDERGRKDIGTSVAGYDEDDRPRVAAQRASTRPDLRQP